ncbi:hypothetical protein WH50_06440 [Pokkaliibacter plantistimulans]|uniref:Pilus assembly protein n=1 Tax=Pokkaliibacter plantistimulans TaxID=1635171 RepID=A0ABX5M5A6_9GAMM|nr:hypothetical protein WH50_06440 [Pokkaliibacter plantistimulans]
MNDNAVVADIKSYQPTRIDPLSLYVRTVYPDDVKTVADAVSFVLGASGYRLVVSYPAPDDAIAILGKPIPPIAKIARTMPIIDAIQILIGTNNWIVVDQNHKLISVSKEPT